MRSASRHLEISRSLEAVKKMPACLSGEKEENGWSRKAGNESVSSSSPSLQLRPSLPPTYLLFISCRFLRHGSHSSSPRDPPRIHPSLFLLSFDARGLVLDLLRLLRLRFPSPLPNRRPQEIRGYRPLPQATRKHSRPSSRAASLLRADISLFFDLSFQASPSFDPPFSPSPLLQGPTTRDPRSSSSE